MLYHILILLIGAAASIVAILASADISSSRVFYTGLVPPRRKRPIVDEKDSLLRGNDEHADQSTSPPVRRTGFGMALRDALREGSDVVLLGPDANVQIAVEGAPGGHLVLGPGAHLVVSYEQLLNLAYSERELKNLKVMRRGLELVLEKIEDRVTTRGQEPRLWEMVVQQAKVVEHCDRTLDDLERRLRHLEESLSGESGAGSEQAHRAPYFRVVQ